MRWKWVGVYVEDCQYRCVYFLWAKKLAVTVSTWA